MSKTRRDMAVEVKRDEVAEGVHSAVEWAAANRTLLTIALVAVVVALIGISAYNGHRQNQERESSKMLSTVLQDSNQLSAASDDKARQTALEAVVKAADNLINSYSGSSAALIALYVKGNAYYKADKFEDARKMYQSYLDQARSDEEKASGEIALGYTFENEAFLKGSSQERNTLEQAMNHYTRAVEFAAGGNTKAPKLPYLYYYGLLCQARVYELIRQEPKAMEIYQQVMAARPAEVQTEEAKTGEDESPLLAIVRRQITQSESLFSFNKTAEMRLERLKAEANAPKTAAAPAAEAAATTATAPAPAPAAAPEVSAAPATTIPAAAATTGTVAQ